MFRRSSGIGILAVAVFMCLYVIASVGTAVSAKGLNQRDLRALEFTNAFLAQSSRAAASRISAHKAVALSQDSESKAMPMPLVMPLFLVDSKFSSTLVLVNGGGAVTYADVAIRDFSGNWVASQRVNFPPHSRQTVDVGAMLAGAGSPTAAGSIVVTPSPQVTSETIAAQLSMTYFGSSEPNYIDEETAMPMPDSSRVLRAVADSSERSPFVAITSLSAGAQHVTVECLGEGHAAFSKQVALAANATFVGPACTAGDSQTTFVDLDRPDFRSQRRHRRATGISLTSDAAPGSFAAFALQPHRTKDGQFFSSVPFSDPKMLMSTNWVFPGVPVGAADQLPGTGYTPEISLANFSSKPRRVTVTYATTSANAPSARKLRTVVLPGGTSKNVSFVKLEGDPTVQNSFVVSSDGAPGDVVAKLVSKSDDGIREIELMAKDEMDTDNGGNHPWSIHDGADATLLLFNPTNSAQYFNVILSGGGVTWYKAYHLQPMQTESIRIRELIQNRVKDDKGNTLPANAQEGQVDWYVPATNAGRGRILETNKAALMARNFSCGGQIEICQAGYFTYEQYIGDNDSVTYADITTQVCMNQCNGTVLGNGGSGLSYSWASNDTGIVSISGSSSVNPVAVYGVSPGSTSLDGDVSDGFCQLQVNPPAPVIQVKINSVSLTSDQVSVTINGPAGIEGMLEVTWNGPNGNADIANVDEGSGTYNFNPPLKNLVSGQYQGVFASWNGVTDGYNTGFDVLGSYLHTQYNTPAESMCSGGSGTGYLTPGPSACAWSTQAMIEQFITQTWENGSGIAQVFGPYKGLCQDYLDGCSAPPGGSSNYFREVSSVSPGCGGGFLSDSSVAVDVWSSNHPLGCGDQVLIVGLGSGAGTVKTVTDSCPACNGSAHIDDYNTSNACSLSSLGNFQTIRINR